MRNSSETRGGENRETHSEDVERQEVPQKDHFADREHLKCSEKYEANEYEYETDSSGRIKRCAGTLRLGEGKANPEQQRKAGGEDRRETDDGGHLIARRFDGSGELDNLVAMDRHLNRSEYKKMENEWAKALQEGKKVETDIRVMYKGDSERPSRIYVAAKITDREGNEETRIYPYKNEDEQYAPHAGGRKWSGH